MKCGRVSAQVVADLVEVLGEGRGQAVRDAQERLQPRERVRERQEQQVHPAFLDRRGLLGGGEGGDVVAVRLHHALGRARWCPTCRRSSRCPRAPVDATRSASVLLVRVGAVAAQAPQRLPRHHRSSAAAAPRSPLMTTICSSCGIWSRASSTLASCAASSTMTVRGAGVVDDVGDQVGRIARIDRHGDAAGAEDREVGLHPLGPAGRQQRDGLALLAAERDAARAPPRARSRRPRAR